MAGESTVYRTIVTPPGGVAIDYSNTLVTEELIAEDFLVPHASANKEIDIAFKHAEVAHYTLKSDVAMHVYVNAASTGSPTQTIALLAGIPITYSGTGTSVFANDVTALYCTVDAGTTDAHLQVIIGTNNAV